METELAVVDTVEVESKRLVVLSTATCLLDVVDESDCTLGQRQGGLEIRRALLLEASAVPVPSLAGAIAEARTTDLVDLARMPPPRPGGDLPPGCQVWVRSVTARSGKPSMSTADPAALDRAYRHELAETYRAGFIATVREIEHHRCTHPTPLEASEAQIERRLKAERLRSWRDAGFPYMMMPPAIKLPIPDTLPGRHVGLIEAVDVDRRLVTIRLGDLRISAEFPKAEDVADLVVGTELAFDVEELRH